LAFKDAADIYMLDLGLTTYNNFFLNASLIATKLWLRMKVTMLWHIISLVAIFFN
jgi:hypothetical protein